MTESQLSRPPVSIALVPVAHVAWKTSTALKAPWNHLGISSSSSSSSITTWTRLDDSRCLNWYVDVDGVDDVCVCTVSKRTGKVPIHWPVIHCLSNSSVRCGTNWTSSSPKTAQWNPLYIPEPMMCFRPIKHAVGHRNAVCVMLEKSPLLQTSSRHMWLQYIAMQVWSSCSKEVIGLQPSFVPTDCKDLRLCGWKLCIENFQSLWRAPLAGSTRKEHQSDHVFWCEATASKDSQRVYRCTYSYVICGLGPHRSGRDQRDWVSQEFWGCVCLAVLTCFNPSGWTDPDNHPQIIRSLMCVSRICRKQRLDWRRSTFSLGSCLKLLRTERIESSTDSSPWMVCRWCNLILRAPFLNEKSSLRRLTCPVSRLDWKLGRVEMEMGHVRNISECYLFH